MSRSQVRSTVRWETVLISMLGTALGTIIGFGFAWTLVHAMKSQDLNTFAVPLEQLGLIVMAAAVAAVMAAALPARRAARLDVLTAISNE